MDLNRTQKTQREALAVAVSSFSVRVVAGPDAGATATASQGRLSIGTADDVSLRLSDPSVSRYHVELQATPDGLSLRDLGSTNGTFVGPVSLREARLTGGTELRLGRTRVTVTPDVARERLALFERASFGGLLGASAPMRMVFAALDKAAPTTAPVLILGETGTGKEVTARALHSASPRADRPFEVVDCGGLPPTLIESELFGHEKGAFTGAGAERAGAFERADGGTLFLDELGELPLELQPKLLRALGEGEVRRLGGRKARKVDVRVVAATNRDLRRAVNANAFRADLYYRVAVVQLHLPPLRERLDDLDLLVPSLLRRICAERGVAGDVPTDEDFMRALREHPWPGNVRELRNYLEQYAVLQVAPPLDDTVGAQGEVEDTGLLAGLDTLPLRAAKAELLERFERRYLSRRIREARGNIAEAARLAGVDRGTVFRAMRRNGMRDDGSGEA